jgi:predicted ATPase
VIAVFDDAHLGREAIQFAEHLLRLRGGARLPLVVLLTVQEEAIEKLPEIAALLDALADHPRAERIVLPALEETDHAQLVHSMLGLEERLARDIARRTSGNPLFAIQLVGDWVERGDLVGGAHGFELRDGASLDLPDDIHDLWSGRLARLFDSLPAVARDDVETALELAALLGVG